MNTRSYRFLAVVPLLAMLSGCQSQSSSTASQGASAANAQGEANKAAVRAFMDQMTQGDTTRVDSLVAENFAEHQMMPGMTPTREGLKAMFVEFHNAFPDMKSTINDMSADGDKVWMYSNLSGTMKGEFMGMKPTGKAFNIEAFDLVRFENGKVAEHWGALDNMTMMQQLGAMPPAPGAAKSKK